MAIEPEDVADLAATPKRVRTDEGTVEERPISEQIEAVKFTKAAEATSNGPPYGMRIARTMPPGTV
jgi:hypothetical protein